MQRICLLFLVALAGCTTSPRDNGSHSRPTADDAFCRLADEYLAGHLAWRPQLGVSLGLHEYDGQLTDFSRASLDAERARLKSFDRRLAGLDPVALSPDTACDYRILRAAIRKELFDFEDLRSYTRNPMTYANAIDVSIYIKRDFAPLEQRVKSIISILHQAPKVTAAARANLDVSLPKPFIETAIEIAGGGADFLGKDLVDALKDLPNASLRAEFATANARAIAELRGFVTYLKDHKLPRANLAFALGREKFARMLREGELIADPPERVLEIGLQELRREQKVFAETARRLDAAKKPIDVFRDIQREHPTAQSLIPDVKKHLEILRQFLLDHQLATLPSEVRPRVEETPPFARATSFASMDSPGPFETKATEAYYYVTPVEKDWTAQQQEQWLTAFNYYTTDVVSMHEVWPGHYLQALCLNASNASRLRKILGSYAFIEGWAHYAEQMMLDEGFGQGAPAASSATGESAAAKYRLAQSDEALLRLCRLCVAIQMHCQGMSVDAATKFFQENCYYEEKPARSEAMRGTFDPGYLYYTLGKLMILKLREDYRRQEGAAFSLKKFHDELLRHGQPPIRLLRPVILKNPALGEATL